MRDREILAAEVEAVTERERTRLIAWLAEHQVPTASTIDREMTADALMVDFVAPLLAQLHSSRTSEEIADIMAEVGFNRMMEVCKERDTANAELARLRAEGEAAAYLIDRLQACHEGRPVRDLPEATGAYLAARAATAREG